MKLFAHQKDILKKFPHKSALVWETGTGKTRASIELALKSKVSCPLFIVPKALKENWQIELGLSMKGRSFVVLTKEEFKRDFDRLAKYDAIVVDEAHYFFGMTSAISKALQSYITKHNPEYIWLLSATVYRSSPWDIFRMAEILGQKMGYWAFRDRFFREIRFGKRRPVPVVKDNIEADIAEIVGRLGSVVRLQDCVDVPEQNFEIEYMTLTDAQKQAMVSVYDVMPIVRFTKYHQICGGTLKSDGYQPDQFFESHKLDRLLEIIDANKKCIVVCRYNNEVGYIASRILDSINNKVVATITGEVDNRHDIIERLKTLEEYVLIVNAACSEGWELPQCPLMIFYSYSFSLKDYIQMIGRIQRINNIKKNTYLSLIVKGTIDEEVYASVQRKEDFHIEIYSQSLIHEQN